MAKAFLWLALAAVIHLSWNFETAIASNEKGPEVSTQVPLIGPTDSLIKRCTKSVASTWGKLRGHPQNFGWLISKRNLRKLTPSAILEANIEGADLNAIANSLSPDEADLIETYATNRALFPGDSNSTSDLQYHLQRRFLGRRGTYQARPLYGLAYNRLLAFRILTAYDKIHGTDLTAESVLICLRHDSWPFEVETSLRIVLESQNPFAAGEIIDLLRQSAKFWNAISQPSGAYSVELQFQKILQKLLEKVTDGKSTPPSSSSLNLFVSRLMVNSIELSESDGLYGKKFRSHPFEYATLLAHYYRLLGDEANAKKYDKIIEVYRHDTVNHAIVLLTKVQAYRKSREPEIPENLIENDLTFKRRLYDSISVLDPR